jgi:hypothetical protein
VLDGKAMLCEVKASRRSLRPPDITVFVALARRLRPDIALLAVMERDFGLSVDLERARSQLASEGIELEILTLDAYELEDSPYLPNWRDE